MISLRTHIRCTGWALAAALLGVAVNAYAQDAAGVAATLAPADPTMDMLVRLLQGGGLPAVLALAAWWARGQIGAGVPVVVSLSPDDRKLLRRLAGDAPTSPGD